jgi:hypothetical protein
MDVQRKPLSERVGKILKFPLLGPKRGAHASGRASVLEARIFERRRRRLAQWINGIWMLLAWAVSAFRVRFAIGHHQVFDAEASIAFVVVVLMPLMLAPKIITAIREAILALRRARTDRKADAL